MFFLEKPALPDKTQCSSWNKPALPDKSSFRATPAVSFQTHFELAPVLCGRSGPWSSPGQQGLVPRLVQWVGV